jgi:hypothetical protein
VSFGEQASDLADDACALVQAVADRQGAAVPEPRDLLPRAPIAAPAELFLRAYAELEAAARDTGPVAAIVAATPAPVIRELARRGQVPREAARIASQLRDIRNQVTHGARELGPVDAENLTVTARALAAICRMAARDRMPA